MHKLLFFLHIVSIICTFSYNLGQANVSLWLSGAAYCNKEKYNTMVLNGPATQFHVTNILYDSATDLQGYVGILKPTIYVVFRGSSSTLNWIDDAEVMKTDYLTYPNSKCKVHTGFYKSCENVKAQVLNSVKSLISKYNYNVIVSGHSYGAAVAQIISMELNANKIESVVYNFGQPRVGDECYCNLVNSLFTGDLYRFVHNKDMVPHIPVVGYYHPFAEIFENANGTMITCIGTNDPTCSTQYSLVQTNTADHSYYLAHELSCETSTSST